MAKLPAHEIQVVRVRDTAVKEIEPGKIAVKNSEEQVVGYIEPDHIEGVKWVDAKSWNPKNAQGLFSLNFNWKPGDPDAKPGQVYLYLVKFVQDGFKNVEFVFDKRAKDPASMKKIKDGLINALKEAPKEVQERFRFDAGIDKNALWKRDVVEKMIKKKIDALMTYVE